MLSYKDYSIISVYEEMNPKDMKPSEKLMKRIKDKEFALKLNTLKLNHYKDIDFKNKKFTERVAKNKKELSDLKAKLSKLK